MVKDIRTKPGFEGGVTGWDEFVELDGAWYFVDQDGVHGLEPWFPTVVGDSLFFSAGGSLNDDRELWVTDGTIDGTVRVLDIEPGEVGSNPASLTEFGGLLYFTAETTASGRELWRSDGTVEGTEMVLDYCPDDCDTYWREQWTPFGDSRVLQVFGDQLLVLTGVGGPDTLNVLREQPVDLLELASEVSNVWAPFFRVGARFFFSGCDPAFGCELWWSDGTAEGTERIEDIWAGSIGSSPSSLGVLGTEFFFFAADGVAGRELWQSDGSAEGTMLVADLAVGPSSSTGLYSNFPGNVVDGRLVFRADDLIHGDEHWTTDGTSAGTVLLADLWPGPTGSRPFLGLGEAAVLGDRLVLSASNADEGRAWWATDGTAEGTELFLDVNQQASAFPPSFLAEPFVRAGQYSSSLLFGADDGTTGLELWITDGTPRGTGLVADLRPGVDAAGLPLWSQPSIFSTGRDRV